jgi:hypothetical protein
MTLEELVDEVPIEECAEEVLSANYMLEFVEGDEFMFGREYISKLHEKLIAHSSKSVVEYNKSKKE